MDYKKKYEELVKHIKHFHQSVNPEWKRTIESYVPEIKESEDEKIRKEIIEFICWAVDRGSITDKQRVKSNLWVAWLEKQDQKKHEEELENAYKCADEVQYRRGYEDAKRELKKQGEKVDVIKNFNTEFERQISHLIASTINKEHEYNEGFVKWAANALLNYAKHELEKQGEQKPIISDDVIREGVAHFGITQYQITNWLKKYVDVKKQGEQKSAWSEEDERMLNSIIEVLEVTPSARFVPIKREIMIPWLESIKERMKGE